ncbi:AbrB/MazE/SpoVT family DNA-binding domain-containing protein [Candidatus Pacearchaeota archaeon]|nr:AbrB/MazE/SpoVT family DNA-binding domain-containing protein [Candidatus Pacearchaeota archaeon]
MIIKRPIGEKGQVVIPKDIRELLNLNRGENVIFEIKNSEVKLKREDPQKFLEEFFSTIKKKRSITPEELKRIREESYDLP